MLRKILISVLVVMGACLGGCASVPMAPESEDLALKQFEAPDPGKSGIYVYRNSVVGQALKKGVFIDGEYLGKTANKVYFYKQIEAGSHVLATESEFGNNELAFEAEEGNNYFFEQYIKMGVFVGGANVKAVTEAEGEEGVSQCKLGLSPSS